jgi:hypothetical protein
VQLVGELLGRRGGMIWAVNRSLLDQPYCSKQL